ncbi:MAG: peptidoglycan DD-metalloendopeptidase family protein [Gammaproteobacteria bacterium]|nr:peptidoglycan DD-metalloendopeptidase family protein [Gammaproteobacteria bacterium]
MSGAAQAEPTEAEARAELEAVRQQIQQLQKQRQRDGEKLSQVERDLKDSEIAEQGARNALSTVQADLKTAQKANTTLLAQQRKQQSELTDMQADLASQMRLAYIQGQEQWLKLVLSQQDPGVMGRRLTWYEYLTRQRTALIGQVQKQLVDLQRIAEELKAEAKRLTALELNRTTALNEVKAARAEREKAVTKLKKDVSSREAQLAALTKQAKELDKLVIELASVLPDMPRLPAGPFANQKGKLSWPVKGRVLKGYGELRSSGQLRWNGVLIAAPSGNNVRAFFHGRVIYADWLQGMGLLMIVEHGDGYLSLYGHNQELLHGVGSWVQPNEVIARVGDSGGQAEPAAYFELRKAGQPISPAPWIKK